MVQLVLGRCIAPAPRDAGTRASAPDGARLVAGQQLHAQPAALQCAARQARHPRAALRPGRSWRASPARRPGAPGGGCHGQRRGAAERGRTQPQRCAAASRLGRTRRLTHRARGLLARCDAFQSERCAAAAARWPATPDAATAAASAAASSNASAASVPAPARLYTHRDAAVAVSVPVLSNTTVSIAGARLQRLQAAHQHAAPRQRAGRGQRRRRRGQRQRAGTGDDQHRHRDAQRVRGPGRPPPGGRAGAASSTASRNGRGDAIGQPGQPRLLDARRAPSGRRSRRSGSARPARSTRT